MPFLSDVLKKYLSLCRKIKTIKKMENKIAKYRIQNKNGTFLNAGTGIDSWFTLDYARKLVNYDIGQRIVEHNGVSILWEVF